MRLASLAAALAWTALACASSGRRPVTAPLAQHPVAPAAPAAQPTPLTRGLGPPEVEARLGAPLRRARVPSAADPGATYEVWTYPDREVVFLDGRVLDPGASTDR